MANGHALLSASGAARWLACTPSARLEATLPDRAGRAADEGTLAHLIGELLIRLELSGVNLDKGEKTIEQLNILSTDPLYTPSMLAYCEDYAAFVIERYNDALSHTKDAVIEQEVKLDYHIYVPEGYGTADNIIIADGTLEIIDLKYGQGVRVEADENKQMMLYALGALEKYDWLYEIDRVKMTIYQPRIDNFSTWITSIKELKEWANTELRPKALLAYDGLGEFVPGSHCQFCRAKAICKANAAYQLDICKEDFKDPVLLDPDEIADVLTRAKGFLSWIKAVNEHALTAAVKDGVKWPGYKLVEGRSVRVYKDPGEIIVTLVGNGFTPAQITKTALLGITELQGIVGKKKFDTLLSDYIIKPPGKPTLAPADDKRPELSSADAARADFAEDETEE